MELWLVRHAESEGNVSGKQDDTPLSALGRRQAESLRGVLDGIVFDAVYSSDLLRCVETAAFALHGVSPQQDPRLRELAEGPKERFIDLGKLSAQEMMALFQKSEAPKAESGVAFRARVKEWLDELPQQGKALAFTHTQVIREVLRLRLPPEGSREYHPIANASLSRLELDSHQTKVISLNDIRHLASL